MADKRKDYSDKINKLNRANSEMKKKFVKKESCVPTVLISAAIIPIIIFLVLYFIQPSFVQKMDEIGETERDMKKVWGWTIGASILLWVSLYLFTYCKGYTKGSMICFDKFLKR